jgi:hypothetical protein
MHILQLCVMAVNIKWIISQFNLGSDKYGGSYRDWKIIKTSYTSAEDRQIHCLVALLAEKE